LLQAFLEDAVAEIAHTDQRELVRTELLTALRAMHERAQARILRFLSTPKRPAAISRSCRAQVYGKPLVISTAAPAPRSRVWCWMRMRDFAQSEYANVHRGVHFLSAAATDRYEAARRTVQKFLNAAREDEIVFTKGGTEAINLVSYSYLRAADPAGRRDRADGDGASFQHRALAFPARTRRARCCAGWMCGTMAAWISRRWTADQAKTKLVAITHMSNVLGTITPLKEIVARAHAKGVPVLADGCQGAVHEPVDVQALDIDFYAHHRPQTVRPHRHRRALCQARASQSHAALQWRRRDDPGSDEGPITYADPPARFEAGTPPIIETVGLGHGAGLSDGAGPQGGGGPRARPSDLRPRAGEAVQLAAGDRRCPGKGAILSFEAEGMHAHDLATILDREGVAVRAGTSLRPGADGAVRRDLHQPGEFCLYNTRADVDALIAGLHKAAGY
jgi:cysteine desulfurase/selenocysteine lyase